jgi:hypothetical protein
MRFGIVDGGGGDVSVLALAGGGELSCHHQELNHPELGWVLK